MKMYLFVILLTSICIGHAKPRERKTGDPSGSCQHLSREIEARFLQSPIYLMPRVDNPSGYNKSLISFELDTNIASSYLVNDLFNSPVIPKYLPTTLHLVFERQYGVSEEGGSAFWCEYRIKEDNTGVLTLALGNVPSIGNLKKMTFMDVQKSGQGIVELIAK